MAGVFSRVRMLPNLRCHKALECLTSFRPAPYHQTIPTAGLQEKWMMSIRRVVTVCIALLVSASLAGGQPAAKKDDKKRNKQEQAEIEQLVKLVDGVMAGQPAPGDIKMSIEPY